MTAFDSNTSHGLLVSIRTHARVGLLVSVRTQGLGCWFHHQVSSAKALVGIAGFWLQFSTFFHIYWKGMLTIVNRA